jgi:hypothetical protein
MRDWMIAGQSSSLPDSTIEGSIFEKFTIVIGKHFLQYLLATPGDPTVR